MKLKEPSTLGALRKKAKARLRRKAEQRLPGANDRSRLLQELSVQQIELLLQNEELRASHAELLESRARYSQIYEFAPFGYFTVDLRGVILESNLQGAELLGSERSLLRNRPFSSFVSYVYRSIFDDFLLSVLDSDVTQECEVEVIRRRDRVFAHLTGILLTTPAPAQVLIAMSDMTRRWRAEQSLEKARQDLETRVLDRTEQLNELNRVLQQKVMETNLVADELLGSKKDLEATNRQLRMLAMQLMDAQDEERRRISRELHDDLGQKLASLAIETQQIQRDLAHGPVTAGALQTLHQRIVHLSQDVHFIAYQLHPSVLDDLRLPLALQAFINEWASRYKVSVKFTQSQLPDVLPNNVASCLYRVMQEGLQNVSKHAATSEIAIHLGQSTRGLLLSIRDYGVGMVSPNGERHRRGLGILGMKERLRLVNGTLSIRSRPGHGTTVIARIPLPQSEA